MLQNNALLAQLKQEIRSATPRVEGTIKGTDKNFGFLETDKGDSYFIPPPAMKRVLHGDRVEAILKQEGEKTSAEPESLIEAGLDRFIGRVRKRDNRLGVVPDHPSIRQTLSARLARRLEESTAVGDGDWVVARLSRHPLKESDRGFFAQIDTLVAPAADPAVPWRVTLARHTLEQSPPETDDDWTLRDEGLEREDLTGEPFFTIDSEATRDMDDALRIEPRPEGGWNLTVAVADPTAYIDEEHAADREARTRAFTVYLPGRNISMLPARLADELCSLHANQDRPTLACTLTVNADGSIGDYRFRAATIRSRAKLAYNQVSDWLEGTGPWRPADDIAPQLQALATLTEARTAWRTEHALMSHERPDYIFDLDDAGNVLEVRIEGRRIANRMVEEAMIAANACGAHFLAEQVGHGIFNTHHAFDTDKLKPTRQFLASQDIEVDNETLTELPRYRELRQLLEARNDPWLETRLRQFQGHTTLSALPGPHFGLGFEAYATWTSPIRKYGDMMNHRLIKSALKHETVPKEACEQLIAQLSERRRLNRLAERDVKNWLYVRYLAPAVKEGRIFEAQVIAINRGGMRVLLTDIGAAAFLPASLIHKNREELVIDDKDGRVHIEGQERFKLGDIIHVALTEAREESRSLVARPAG